MRGRLVAVAALSLLTSVAALPSSTRAMEVNAPKSVAAGPQTEIDIPRIKSVLKLSPEQLESWTTLESALVAIAREQAQRIANAPAGRRVVAIAFDNGNMQRLANAAMPLIKTLRPDQKKVAQELARQIGLGAYAAFI